MEVIDLKNRNMTFIPESLIQEIGNFVKVSIKCTNIKFYINSNLY